jgi:hypothetical protein
MFEEMLDRAVVSHPPALAPTHAASGGRPGPSRLLRKEYRLHFRFVDLGLMLRSGKLVSKTVKNWCRARVSTAPTAFWHSHPSPST